MNRKGLTIVELLIGSLIGTGVVLILGVLLRDQFSFLKKLETKQSQTGDIRLLTQELNQLLSSEVQLRSFTGSEPWDAKSFRFIVPLPERGRDLNAVMPHSGVYGTSLLFATLEGSKKPSVRVICLLGANHDQYALLVDTASGQRGPVTFNTNPANTFTVASTSPSEPSGDLGIGKGQIFSLLDGALGYLFIARGNPSAFSLVNDSAGQNPPAGIHAGCVPHLRRTGAFHASGMPQYATDNLVQIPVMGFAIRNISGIPANIPTGEIQTVAARMPLWMTSAAIYSAGPMPIPGNSTAAQFGITKCHFHPPTHDNLGPYNTDIACTAAPQMTVGPMTSARLIMGFSMQLSNNDRLFRYEMQRQRDPAVPLHPFCTAPECDRMIGASDLNSCGFRYYGLLPLALNVSLCHEPNNPAIARESITQWRPGAYGLKKSDFVRSLQFIFDYQGGTSDRLNLEF